MVVNDAPMGPHGNKQSFGLCRKITTSTAYGQASAKPPDSTHTEDVDIAVAGVVATDVVVALPFGAHADIRQHVPLHAGAIGQAGVGVVRAPIPTSSNAFTPMAALAPPALAFVSPRLW